MLRLVEPISNGDTCPPIPVSGAASLSLNIWILEEQVSVWSDILFQACIKKGETAVTSKGSGVFWVISCS